MNMRALLFSARDGLLLLPWAILVGLTFRASPYGLTEEGAKALLLAWSIGDQVASAVLTLGAPDIRAILFLPLGFLWSGQVIAAKVLTLLTMAGAGVALYRWRRREDQDEAALLATGLLLIAPLTVESISALSAAPFLLAICGAAAWLNQMLGSERGALGGSFFSQLLLCGAAVSLHPAGLAYPAVLFFTWWSKPPDERHRRHFLLGIPLVVLLVLTMRLGWPGMAWGQNPLSAAAAVFFGNRTENPLSIEDWLIGLTVLALTSAVALHERRRLVADLTGGTLLLGVLFGAVAADRTWGVLMLALLLYGGLPWLLRACAPLAGRGLLVQRGWLWLLLLLTCTSFMRTHKSDYEAGRDDLLSAQDQLIRGFVEGVSSLQTGERAGGQPAAPILVASSWPARTSIACKCDGLPLPPVAKDPEKQLAMMRGVSYMILADSTDNRGLANNFAQLGPRVEVLSRQPGGVVLHFKPDLSIPPVHTL
jgi:hypothetical protein